jgi:hypothetical protein
VAGTAADLQTGRGQACQCPKFRPAALSGWIPISKAIASLFRIQRAPLRLSRANPISNAIALHTRLGSEQGWQAIRTVVRTTNVAFAVLQPP